MDHQEEDSKKAPKNWAPTPTQSGLFLLAVSGFAALGSFGTMLAKSRKADPTDFEKGVIPEKNLESGAKLASRALKRATFYSVGGFSLFCFAVWKLTGASDMKDFGVKMKQMTSSVPKVTRPPKEGESDGWEELFGKTGENTVNKSDQQG